MVASSHDHLKLLLLLWLLSHFTIKIIQIYQIELKETTISLVYPRKTLANFYINTSYLDY